MWDSAHKRIIQICCCDVIAMHEELILTRRCMPRWQIKKYAMLEVLILLR